MSASFNWLSEAEVTCYPEKLQKLTHQCTDLLAYYDSDYNKYHTSAYYNQPDYNNYANNYNIGQSPIIGHYNAIIGKYNIFKKNILYFS